MKNVQEWRTYLWLVVHFQLKGSRWNGRRENVKGPGRHFDHTEVLSSKKVHTGSFNNPLSSTCINYLTKTVAMLNWMHMHHFPLVFKAVHMNQLAWPLGDTTQSAMCYLCWGSKNNIWSMGSYNVYKSKIFFLWSITVCFFIFQIFRASAALLIWLITYAWLCKRVFFPAQTETVWAHHASLIDLFFSYV